MPKQTVNHGPLILFIALLLCAPCNPLTLPYNHFSIAVLPVIVIAAPAKSTARCVVLSCPKRGYGYHPLCLKHCSTQAQYETASAEDSPMAGSTWIVQGGERKRKSIVRRMDGMAWKPTSAIGATFKSGGTTNDLSIALMPQYRTLIKTSSGALQSDRLFLTMKSRGERVMSPRRPKMKVVVANVSPIIVRYCQCHP